MKAAKSKKKAGIIGVKLIVLLCFISIPVIKTSSMNATITSCNSGNGDDYPINFMIEQAEYSDTTRDNVHQNFVLHLSHETLAPIKMEKAVGVYVILSEYPNPEGIFEAKALSP